MEANAPRTVRWAFAVAMLGLGLSVAASPAYACTCVVEQSPCTTLAQADAVFEGVVESSAMAAPLSAPVVAGRTVEIRQRKVLFRDVQSYVGLPASSVTTNADGASCGVEFEPGERYLVVAQRRVSDGVLVVSRCSQTRKLQAADPWRDYAASLSKGEKGSRIWGIVTLAGRQPVAGARVIVGGRRNVSVTTGDDGRYSIAGLPEGRYQVSVQAPATLARARTGPAIPASLDGRTRCAEVPLTISPDTRITGVVTNVRAEGPVRPVVELWWQPDPKTTARKTISHQVDVNGAYTFWDPVPGRYFVGVNVGARPTLLFPYQEGIAEAAGGGRFVEVALGGRIAMSPLALQNVTVTKISGTVRHRDGSPAQGVTVRLWGFGARPEVTFATSTADGSFAFRALGGERYRFSAYVDRQVVAEVEAAADTGLVTLTLPD